MSTLVIQPDDGLHEGRNMQLLIATHHR